MNVEVRPGAEKSPFSLPASDENLEKYDYLDVPHGSIKSVSTIEYETLFNFDGSFTTPVCKRSVKKVPEGQEKILIEFDSLTVVEFEHSSAMSAQESVKYGQFVFDRVIRYIEKYCDKFPEHFEFWGDSYRYTMSDLRNIFLPENAPEDWLGLRAATEDLPDFFRRVWGKYLRLGLTYADIRQRDKKLYNAINKWIHRDDKDWPADLAIPTQSQILQKTMDLFGEEGAKALTPKQLTSVARKLQRNADSNRPALSASRASSLKTKTLQI